MAGMFKFDFYCKAWHMDTRGLSDREKGCYIDLLSAMYARGGPLPYDEQELCGIANYRTVRSLRFVLGGLINKGKFKVVDGHLVNRRTMEEIANYERRLEGARKGGKAKSARVQAELGSNTSWIQAEKEGGIEEKQGDDPCLSPSPSPSPSKKYFFSGEVIRLTEKDFTDWQTLYHGIPDLVADLTGLDGWWSELHPAGSPKRDKWWHPIRGALNKKHQKYLAERADNDPDAGYWDDMKAGIIH